MSIKEREELNGMDEQERARGFEEYKEKKKL